MLKTLRLTRRGRPRLYTASLSTSPRDRVRQTHLDLLRESLDNPGDSSGVWDSYTNLLTFLGGEPLPLHIHQQVLRKCTPPTAELRTSATRRLFAAGSPSVPHKNAGRFAAVVQNMRSAGFIPTLDDFNFILEQFAAVGHVQGVMDVYRDLVKLDIVPRSRTFGLCLQAIAHSLTLPIAPDNRSQSVATARRMVGELMQGMSDNNKLQTSVNLDLILRILRETSDTEQFHSFLEEAYGIVLSKPDCPPEKYLVEAQYQPPPPQPFSVAALNMTLDTLGRSGDLQRLVQTFEVLTTPLPQRNTSVDEDDEDDFGFRQEHDFPFPRPAVQPNTTTYNILLRHLCRMGHSVLARHYLNQAMSLEREIGHALRLRIFAKAPLADILSPTFAINRGTLLSVYGHSNRNKDFGLMRWVLSKMPAIIRWKRSQRSFLTWHRNIFLRQRRPPYDDDAMHTRTVNLGERREKARLLVTGPDAEEYEVELPKSIDLEMHLALLARDMAEIEELRQDVTQKLARTAYRVKERLTRRVYASKDIHLATEAQATEVEATEAQATEVQATEVQADQDRFVISREDWNKIANFRQSDSKYARSGAPLPKENPRSGEE
ncbi:hypothetical protein MKEN_00073400 [Mycena kentingensis (nom. inval.)]|nr:hypothetical protein MKEN_00073400 [Mycena kentingensis (nom. inval.)]